MKTIGYYFVIGLVVALLGGLVISQFFGSAYLLGIGLYLCVVIVTCTGVIVSKLDLISKNSSSKDEDI